MEKPFKTERAARQQRLIGESMMALMAERGYGEITVSAICERAGIPRRTFYYYFENREQVLTAVLDQMLNECSLEAMLPPAGDRAALEAGFARYFRYWRDSRGDALKVLLKNGLEQQMVSQCMRWVDEEPTWSSLSSGMPDDLRTVGSLLGITCVFYILFYWCAGDFAQPPEQLAAYVTRLLTNPIYDVN